MSDFLTDTLAVEDDHVFSGFARKLGEQAGRKLFIAPVVGGDGPDLYVYLTGRGKTVLVCAVNEEFGITDYSKAPKWVRDIISNDWDNFGCPLVEAY